ncbi:hypothetical protein [Ornithinimicrobium kibberense]
MWLSPAPLHTSSSAPSRVWRSRSGAPSSRSARHTWPRLTQ